MKICKNIDLVQLNLAGEGDVNFPRSVDWKNKKVHHIVVACPDEVSGEDLYAPDGTRILTRTDLTMPNNRLCGLYFDFYKEGGELLARSLSVGELLSTNDHPFVIDGVLDLTLTKVRATYPLQGALLVYVFYDEVEVEDAASKSITVEFPLSAMERMSFADLVNNYVHIQPQMIRSIVDWTAAEAPCLMMLRSFGGEAVFNHVLSTLMKPTTGGTYGLNLTRKQLLLPCVDIDFDYSYVQNIQQASVNKILTFEY